MYMEMNLTYLGAVPLIAFLWACITISTAFAKDFGGLLTFVHIIPPLGLQTTHLHYDVVLGWFLGWPRYALLKMLLP